MRQKSATSEPRMSSNWSAPTDPESVRRRAGGRRRCTARRRLQALLRRVKVFKMLEDVDYLTRGVKADIARALGVHRSTIGRDVKQIFYRNTCCPMCGSIVTIERLEKGMAELAEEE